MRSRWTSFLAAFLILASLGLLGCHSSSPTSPGSLQIVITAGMLNTALTPTILEAQLLYDGVIAADSASTTPTAIVTLNATGGTTSGAHTLAFAVVNQTSSPNTYTVPAPDIQVFDGNGNFIRDIKLNATTASLTTGQLVTYSLTI